MNKDFYLMNKFSKLKIHWWILLIPFINNCSYLTIFKSWFSAFSDRYFISFEYKKAIMRTQGVYYFSIFICLGIVIILLLIDTIMDNNIFQFSLYIIAANIIFNLIFCPINLYCEPKRTLKNYQKYYFNKYQKVLNFNDINYFENPGYNLYQSLLNIKNNLFNLDYYSFFYFDKNKTITLTEADKKVINDFYLKNFPNLEKRYKDTNRSPNAGFGYLYTTGLWITSVISMIYRLLDNKDKYYWKIQIISVVYMLFMLSINISFITIILLNQHDRISIFTNFYYSLLL